MLLVLDNASATDQIADLLPRSRKHRVLVTSRHTLTVRGSRTLDLGILTEHAAMTLISRQLESMQAWDTRIGDDPEGTRRLCRLCGHLPLALHIATALLAGDPDLSPAELAGDLAKAHSKLDLLDDGERAVRAAFELSYRRLSDEQARLFRLLPVNPGPHFGLDTARCLLNVDMHRARPVLRELARAHMVEHIGAGKWRQHDLIRDYAIELSQSLADGQEGPATRLLDHYTFTGVAAARVLRADARTPDADSDAVQQALAWFDQEQPNLQASISMALTFGDSDHALRMLQALVRLYHHRDQTSEAIETCERIITVARDVDESGSKGWALAGTAWKLGAGTGRRAETAALDRLLDFDAEALQAWSHLNWVPAASLLRELIRTIQDAVGSVSPETELATVPLLHEIARVGAVIGVHDDTAADALKLAARISRRRGSAPLRALSWALRAQDMLRRNRIGLAVTSIEAALNAFPQDVEQDSPEWTEICGLLAAAADDIPAALRRRGFDLHLGLLERACQAAAEAHGRMGDRMGEARLRARIGTAYHEAGTYESAVAHYEDAVRLLDGLDKANELALALVNLSLAHLALHDNESAERAAERASALLDRQGEPYSLSQALELLTYVYIELQRLDDAVEFCRRNEKAAAAVGRLSSHLSAAFALATALLRVGRRRDAVRIAGQTKKVTAASSDSSLLYEYSSYAWPRPRGSSAD